jgi:hypothetical protein
LRAPTGAGCPSLSCDPARPSGAAGPRFGRATAPHPCAPSRGPCALRLAVLAPRSARPGRGWPRARRRAVDPPVRAERESLTSSSTSASSGDSSQCRWSIAVSPRIRPRSSALGRFSFARTTSPLGPNAKPSPRVGMVPGDVVPRGSPVTFRSSSHSTASLLIQTQQPQRVLAQLTMRPSASAATASSWEPLRSFTPSTA